jgi:replicative DNA helicase
MIAKDIESAVIGNLLNFPEQLNTVEVNPDVFNSITNLKIAKTVLELRRQGHVINRATVSTALPEFTNAVWTVGDDVVSPTLNYYYEQAVEIWRMRESLVAARGAIEEAQTLPPAEVYANLQHRVDRLRTAAAENFEWLPETFDGVMTGLDNKPEIVPTPFKKLNDIIDGFRPGAMYVVAARPGVGKTMLGVEFAHHAAKQTGVLYFSMEMSKHELTKRIISSVSSVEASKIFRGELDQQTRERVNAARSKLADGLMIDDRPAATIDRIRSVYHKASATREVKLIVIDYLGLMEDSQKGRGRYEKVTNISNDIKRLARELSVPIVALHQLNRAVENRADPKPTLSDLRDSGAIEQDADVVMLLHRETDANFAFLNEMRVGVLKNRHGMQDLVDLQIHPAYLRIVG